MRNVFYKGLTAAFVLFVALVPVLTKAADFRADKSGATSVNQAVNDDLYVAGNSVSINAPVSGDNFVAGSNVMLSGTVGGSIVGAGATVTVLGNVEKNVRIVGGTVYINGNVGHDLIVLAGQVVVASSAKVSGDVVVLGGNVTLDGPVNGNVYVRGGEVVINSAINGSANVSAHTLSFGSDAKINGGLMYSTPLQMQLREGLVGGEVKYTQMADQAQKTDQQSFASFITFVALIKIITLIVITLALVLIFKKRALAMAQNGIAHFGRNALYGFAALIAIPFASIFILITAIGAPIAVIAMSAYVIMVVLAGFGAPIILGSLAWKIVRRSKTYEVNVYSTLLGVASYLIIGVIPVIGWGFDFAFFLVALGTLVVGVGKGLQTSEPK